MAVQFLSSSAWREFRGVAGRGANESTHLALVADSQGAQHHCYVKLMDPSRPNLLCESVGFILATALQIPAPTFGSILMVPLAKLSPHMTLPDWTMGMTEAPAWGCGLVRGKSIMQVRKWARWLAVRRCLTSPDTKAIASFDIWADNNDRNFGNVVRSNGRYVAIDHEALLHTLFPQFQRRSIMDWAKNGLSFEDFEAFCVSVASNAKDHHLGYLAAQHEITSVLKTLYPAVAVDVAVNNFLSARAAPSFVANELGVIV